MAGDFVMVQHATPRKPEVLRLAASLNIEPAHAFGLCVITWMWFDEQTEDGRALGATEAMLDAVVCRAGFTQALSNVGWLSIREGSLEVPNFDRLMGQSAKKRAKNTKRQQKHRRAPVTSLSHIKRDKSATKEEKRREEKKKERDAPFSFPLSLDTPEFHIAWSDWQLHRIEKKKPLTPTSIKQQLKMLQSHGVARAIAMIEHTIAMGWEGLREAEANGRPLPPKPPSAPPANAPPPPKRVSPVDFKHDPYSTTATTKPVQAKTDNGSGPTNSNPQGMVGAGD